MRHGPGIVPQFSSGDNTKGSVGQCYDSSTCSWRYVDTDGQPDHVSPGVGRRVRREGCYLIGAERAERQSRPRWRTDKLPIEPWCTHDIRGWDKARQASVKLNGNTRRRGLNRRYFGVQHLDENIERKRPNAGNGTPVHSVSDPRAPKRNVRLSPALKPTSPARAIPSAK